MRHPIRSRAHRAPFLRLPGLRISRSIVAALAALAATVFVSGCTPAEEASSNPLNDDCTEGRNDEPATATGVPAEDGFSADGLQICAGDLDYFSMTVEPGTLAYFEISFAEEVDLMLDLYDENGKKMDAADSGLPYERVALLTPQDEEPHTYTLRVKGYQGSTGDYSLHVRTFPYEDGLTCEDDCLRILQFPAPHADEGYLFDTWAEFRNARRELVQIIRYAIDRTYKRYPGTQKLGLIDMSERDGSTPGTAYDDLRHPHGTHIQGNDIDIAYFQTTPDNHARPVCENDGYFCTSETNTMDAEITAYFMAQIYASNRLRVIGVDTTLADDLQAAADALLAEGAINATQHAKFDDRLAWGEGWPFHHHHMHVSLKWVDDEDVYEATAPLDPAAGWDIDPYSGLH